MSLKFFLATLPGLVLPSVEPWQGAFLPQEAAINNASGVLQQLQSPVPRPDLHSPDTTDRDKNKVHSFSSSWFSGVALLLVKTMGRRKIPRGNGSSPSRGILNPGVQL